MTTVIAYETPNGTDTIERNAYNIKERVVVAYDNKSDFGGVSNKTTIPLQRVVRIDE